MTVLNFAFFFILGPSQKMVEETWETNWIKLAWLCLLEDVKLQMSLSLPLWSKVRKIKTIDGVYEVILVGETTWKIPHY